MMSPRASEEANRANLGSVALSHGTENAGDHSMASSSDIGDPEKGVDGSADNSSEPEVRTIRGFKWFLVCFSLYAGAFVYGLDTTIAADVQAAVIETFGEVQKLTWIGTGYPLGSVSVIMPLGTLYGNFDMKWLYIVTLALFEAASALCGAAPTMNVLVVGRVIAGLGGSGVYLGALNFISVCTTPKERGGYIAGIGFIWGLGSILGPVIGGLFSTSPPTWRWSFYINLVIAGVCAPIYLFFLPSVKQNPGVPVKSKLAKIDWIGCLLWAGFVVSFTVVLTFAGASWPWKDARTIVVWLVFGLLLVLFILQQRFCWFTTLDRRIFPGHLLKSRTQVLLFMGTSSAATNLFVPVYYIPIYFQFVHGDTALYAAVRLLPFVIILIFINMVAGAALPRIGYYMPLYALAGVFMLIGGALMYTVSLNTKAGAVYGYSVLIGIGSGLTIQAGYSIATVKRMQKNRADDIVNAVSFQNVAQIGGTLVALVISGQAFQSAARNKLGQVLAGQGFSQQDLEGAISGLQSHVFESISGDLKTRAVEAIVSAVSNVWVLSLTAGCVSLVISPFMKRERLFGMTAAAGG